MSLPTDYGQNKYLAVTFRRDTGYIANPAALALQPSLSELVHVGQIGQLDDAHLYSIPLSKWEAFDLSRLREVQGVSSVSIQEPKMRTKRAEDL